MLVAASSPLTKVVPGLMIWTVIFFFVVFFVLRKYAFGPLQNMLDQRRDSIRQSVEAADHARAEAERLLEEHRKLIAEARGQGEAILAEARKTRDSMEQRMREETEAEREGGDPRRSRRRGGAAVGALPPGGGGEGPRGRARRDREGVRAVDGARGAAPDRGADHGARADGRRGGGDPEADRRCGGTQGRGDAEGRRRPGRRHRPAGGLAPRRRGRARE